MNYSKKISKEDWMTTGKLCQTILMEDLTGKTRLRDRRQSRKYLQG